VVIDGGELKGAGMLEDIPELWDQMEMMIKAKKINNTYIFNI
jgi:hypothetical protein